MKKLITIIIALTLANPLMSQGKTSFNDMNAQEIRQFLLAQKDSELAIEMTKKHNTSRIVAYSFFAAAVVLAIASDSTVDPDNSVNSTSLAVYSALSFGIAAGCGIAANERLKKAKDIYLNRSTNSEKQAFIQIRNESKIIDSIFKYPTPH